MVFTFDPHPAQILRPERAPTPLGWTERNAELLGQLGVDAVIAFPTDQDFLQLDARTFFERIVCDRLGARAMVEGPNFFFGHNRGGTIDVLRQYCDAEGIVLEVVVPIEIDDQLVSSSRIRKLVAAGEVAAAARVAQPAPTASRVRSSGEPAEATRWVFPRPTWNTSPR